MNPAWPEIPFERIVRDTKDGEWGESAPGMGLREVLIIRGTDFESVNSPSADFPRRWVPEHLVARKQLEAGDLILETAGGTSSQSTGRSVLLKSSFFEQHPELPVLCASFSRHLRTDHENFDARFLSYLLQTLYRSGYMSVFNIQHTGVSRFQFTTFKNHTKLRIPKKPIQRKIAAVLAAYDDLIEANRRRIALLERMAEEIYREWFVRLRFPGHEKTKITRGVPSAWRVERLGQIMELRYGKALKEEDRVAGPYAVYGSSGIVGTHNEAHILKPGLIVGRKGNVGSVFMSDGGFFVIDTAFYVVSSLPLSFLYFLLRSMNFINNDSAVPGLNRSQAYANQFFLPPAQLIADYARIAEPNFSAAGNLRAQNAFLQRTRDLLLPRLISGKLSLEALDIAFPPSMAEATNA